MPSWEDIEREAAALVADAAHRGAVLRVVGSTAIRLRFAEAPALMDDAQRRAKDIDLACRKEDRTSIRDLLERRGYVVDRDMLVAMEGARYAFRHPERRMEVDLFVDRLEFCHTIDLRGRLDRHAVTIAAEDLLLQKLQIVELTPSDLLDSLVLLACCDIGAGGDADVIDVHYIVGLLGRDWGFHRTVSRNLERLRDTAASAPPEGLAPERVATAIERARRIEEALANGPKSMGWRMRAKLGERAQWWQDVHEAREAY